MSTRVLPFALGGGLWLLGGLASAATAPAEAQSPAPSQCPICRHANKTSGPYMAQATGSLARGLTNTFFGWTEMLIRPTAEVERSGNLVTGIGQGISHAARRTAAGLGEALTFWMPKSAGAPPPLAVDCPICVSTKSQ